jgi:EAL domain-containing protein (putative c-di-GMP-specific phosphodiesterase class I)
LTDLIRMLNSPHAAIPKRYTSSGLDQPFFAADGRIFLHYANIRLESLFLPIVETTSGRAYGHAASIQAFGLSNDLPLAPEAVFVLPTDDVEFVYLDRLVRTLHALNYLTNPTRGNLLLKVHPRHVQTVSADHGLAFEEILRPCGLIPEQITLEIDTSPIEDTLHLIKAVDNYRSRGYSIAISHFGRNKLDFTLLRDLHPDIVKLDPLLLSSSRPLKRIIANLHDLPSRVMIEGIHTSAMRKGAVAGQIDLLQAYAPLLRLVDTPPPRTANHWTAIKSAA